MRRSLFLVPFTLLLAGPAQSETVLISGTITPVALGNACSNAGGTFTSHDSGYGCRKENCDGKGGNCQIDCTDAGQCIGSTPQQILQSTGMTLLGLLQNGNMVFHSPQGSFGGGSLSSSGGDSGAPTLR